ncbi:MAG: hypothetical protein ACUVS2_14510 [Candidatus Flexifilum sp.]|jgi:predicted PurR-regulated permease PerM
MARIDEQGIEATRRRRRRQNRREIVLPFAIALFILIGLVLLTAVLPREGVPSVTANLLATLFFLCPLALCLLPFALMLVAAIYGLGQLNERAARPLIAVERLSIQARQSAERLGQQIAERTIALSSAYEQFDRAVISKLDAAGAQQPATGKRDHDESGNTTV